MSSPVEVQDRSRPALYMVWDGAASVTASVSASYEVVTVPDRKIASHRSLLEAEWPVDDAAWAEFVERVIPSGMFVARLATTGAPVGTVSVMHNPRGSRFFFPGGAAIAYLSVIAPHRGHRLGSALTARALERARDAGYRVVWLGVQEWRLPAIVTYLDTGFVPFLHPPDADGLLARWLDVYRQIGRAPTPERWLRELRTAQ